MADDTSGALGNLFTAGMGFATGNPIAAISGIAGLGLSIAGGVDKVNIAGQQAAASSTFADQTLASQTAQAGLEQQQEGVRRQAMEVSARRQNMEVLRNAQRARAMGLNSATNQGAQLGSGLQGGYGQIAGQSGVNALGINQNLQSGEEMFGLNNQISQQKLLQAQAQNTYAKTSASLGTQSATASGISALGSGLLGASGSFKNLGTLGSSSSSSGGGSSPSYGGWMSSMGTGGLI